MRRFNCNLIVEARYTEVDLDLINSGNSCLYSLNRTGRVSRKSHISYLLPQGGFYLLRGQGCVQLRSRYIGLPRRLVIEREAILAAI